VREIIKDYEEPDQVNKELEKLGYNIGMFLELVYLRFFYLIVSRHPFDRRFSCKVGSWYVHTWGIQGVLGSIQTYKIGNCSSFEESAEIISRVAFKMFLGIRATVSNWNNEYNSCSIMFEENPLAEYVELPVSSGTLVYSYTDSVYLA
jgi:hypothetical protein